MLDTRRNPPIVHSPEGFDYRPGARPKPSFGLGSLRSRKRLLGFTTLVFLAIGLFYAALRPTTYTASSQLLVYIRQILTGADLAILPGRADLPLVQNQIEVLRSGNVLTQVIESLQLNKDPEFSERDLLGFGTQKNPLSPMPPQAGKIDGLSNTTLDAVRRKLSVRQIGTSHMVRVSFKATEPEKAARIVNSVIRFYLQELMRASDAGSSKAPALRELYQSLGPSAHLFSEAEPPVKPDGPGTALILLVAALLGLTVGATVAVLLDAVNDSIRSAQQLEYVLGLECLGIIPRQTGHHIASNGTGVEHASQRQTALRSMAAAVLTPSLRGLRTIGVTSTLPGEGASTLAIGLAETVVSLGKRVLLIDCVPENPSVSRWAASSPRVPPRPSGEVCFKEIDQVVKVRAGLHVLPLAKLSDRETRAMRPGVLDEILGGATGSYDLVILDMPSLAAGPEVRAAARLVDGFLLVVKWGVTESELIRQGFQSIGEAGSKFVGAVLNMADEQAMARYGYEFPAGLKAPAVS